MAIYFIRDASSNDDDYLYFCNVIRRIFPHFPFFRPFHCTTNLIYWIASEMQEPRTSAAGTSIAVLRACGKLCGKRRKSSGAGTSKSATWRRDAVTLLLRSMSRWESDFLLFGPEIGSLSGDPPATWRPGAS